MIVRNEARFIDDCLKSLVDTVDEIILVDTGSSDDTVAKARRYPVEIRHFAWCDDFSAARNFAIEQASGEWLLYIDADERFGVPDRSHLDAVLADEGKAAWNIRFHPRLDWTPYAEPRLFRNDPRIRFTGAIHETMRPGIRSVMQADGRQTGTSRLVLQHVGYEDDQSHKNSRNIPLLHERLARDPEHLYSLWHLGDCLRLAGDEEGAIDSWMRGVAAAKKRPVTERRPDDSLSVLSLVKLKFKRGEPADELLRDACGQFPDQLALRWIAAARALEREDDDAARPLLEQLAAIDADDFFDPYLSYEKILFRYLAKEALALCHFRAGRYAEAAHWYRLVAPHHPDSRACEVKALLADARATR